MRKIINRIALAVAGLGLITGSALADAPSRLHDEIRHRIIDQVGVEAVSADAVRTALTEDPDFGLLLEYYQERSMNSLRHSHHGEDAVQETLLKIWKGQPQLFLKPFDEVIRYFQTANKCNAITAFKKETNHRESGVTAGERLLALPQNRFPDPAMEAASQDLLDELSVRLDRVDLEVLEAYLSSPSSQRKIAEEIGISRYAAGQSTEKIKELLRALLDRGLEAEVPGFSSAKTTGC